MHSNNVYTTPNGSYYDHDLYGGCNSPKQQSSFDTDLRKLLELKGFFRQKPTNQLPQQNFAEDNFDEWDICFMSSQPEPSRHCLVSKPAIRERAQPSTYVPKPKFPAWSKNRKRKNTGKKSNRIEVKTLKAPSRQNTNLPVIVQPVEITSIPVIVDDEPPTKKVVPDLSCPKSQLLGNDTATNFKASSPSQVDASQSASSPTNGERCSSLSVSSLSSPTKAACQAPIPCLDGEVAVQIDSGPVQRRSDFLADRTQQWVASKPIRHSNSKIEMEPSLTSSLITTPKSEYFKAPPNISPVTSIFHSFQLPMTSPSSFGGSRGKCLPFSSYESLSPTAPVNSYALPKSPLKTQNSTESYVKPKKKFRRNRLNKKSDGSRQLYQDKNISQSKTRSRSRSRSLNRKSSKASGYTSFQRKSDTVPCTSKAVADSVPDNKIKTYGDYLRAKQSKQVLSVATESSVTSDALSWNSIKSALDYLNTQKEQQRLREASLEARKRRARLAEIALKVQPVGPRKSKASTGNKQKGSEKQNEIFEVETTSGGAACSQKRTAIASSLQSTVVTNSSSTADHTKHAAVAKAANLSGKKQDEISTEPLCNLNKKILKSPEQSATFSEPIGARISNLRRAKRPQLGCFSALLGLRPLTGIVKTPEDATCLYTNPELEWPEESPIAHILSSNKLKTELQVDEGIPVNVLDEYQTSSFDESVDSVRIVDANTSQKNDSPGINHLEELVIKQEPCFVTNESCEVNVSATSNQNIDCSKTHATDGMLFKVKTEPESEPKSVQDDVVLITSAHGLKTLAGNSPKESRQNTLYASVHLTLNNENISAVSTTPVHPIDQVSPLDLSKTNSPIVNKQTLGSSVMLTPPTTPINDHSLTSMPTTVATSQENIVDITSLIFIYSANTVLVDADQHAAADIAESDLKADAVRQKFFNERSIINDITRHLTSPLVARQPFLNTMGFFDLAAIESALDILGNTEESNIYKELLNKYGFNTRCNPKLFQWCGALLRQSLNRLNNETAAEYLERLLQVP